ncbi:MAG: hypothetical protein V3W11_06070 [bacterium]
MKRLAFILTALVIIAVSTCLAHLGDVKRSFPAPGNQIRGMARSNIRLFVIDFGSSTRVYRLAPATGSSYGSWTTSFSNKCSGLAFSEGGVLWIGCYGDDRVYKCKALTGSVYYRWNAGHEPYGVAPHRTSDGGIGTTAIFTSDSAPSFCWRHNMTSGSVLSSFGMASASSFDIAWDQRNKLIWKGSLPNVVYGYNTAGSVAASFTVPGHSPRGLAYYGQYLWVGCDGNDRIYQVHCPGDITSDVSPASFGGVKALFR